MQRNESPIAVYGSSVAEHRDLASAKSKITTRLKVSCGSPSITNVIPDRHKLEVAKVASDERGRRGTAFTPDHVVAGLSFGFWQNLMGNKLEFTLWRDGILSAFPNLPPGFSREEVYKRLERLRKFRNSIMHHYAIFDKGPTDEYRNIRTLLDWMCPETLWLMSQLSNPAAVIQRRPAN